MRYYVTKVQAYDAARRRVVRTRQKCYVYAHAGKYFISLEERSHECLGYINPLDVNKDL